MGSVEEKPGFFGSNWVTIVLIVVLLVFATILIIILKTGGFDRFKRKPSKKPELKPGAMYQLHQPEGQAELEWVGDKLRVIV
jgi:hypothetical protein